MEKEYVVTVKEGVNWEDVHNDLIAHGTIDPKFIPARSVDVANFREHSERNTHYFLTEEEANALREDPRIEDVVDPSIFKPISFKYQTGTFDRLSTSEGQRVNWGLIRHIKKFNVWGGTTGAVSYDYDYVLDGTGVDIVILDAGIEPNHPEFQDADGNSRVRQINWYLTTGQPGSMPPNHYSDYDGHGTHVAATAAGKTYGWAKNADIYFMKIVPEANDPNGTIPIEDAMDMLYAWHIGKQGLRPTVINNSWGYSVFWHTDRTALSYSPNSGPYYSITGMGYRGATVQPPFNRAPEIGQTGQQISANVWSFPLPYFAVDADIQQLVAAGVVVCNAAGNHSVKADLPGGVDYNNYVEAAGRYYYHRPGSPSCGNQPGFRVGALDSASINNKDQKADYSNSGPAVNVWAAGTDIQSAFSNINTPNTAYTYFQDGTWRQQNYSGTSMAAPQVTGMAALVLQVYPDWSPNQVVKFLTSNAQPEIYSTGDIDDYEVTNSLLGSQNRLAYFPMNGRKTFGYAGDQMMIA